MDTSPALDPLHLRTEHADPGLGREGREESRPGNVKTVPEHRVPRAVLISGPQSQEADGTAVKCWMMKF